MNLNHNRRVVYAEKPEPFTSNFVLSIKMASDFEDDSDGDYVPPGQSCHGRALFMS